MPMRCYFSEGAPAPPFFYFFIYGIAISVHTCYNATKRRKGERIVEYKLKAGERKTTIIVNDKLWREVGILAAARGTRKRSVLEAALAAYVQKHKSERVV